MKCYIVYNRLTVLQLRIWPLISFRDIETLKNGFDGSLAEVLTQRQQYKKKPIEI